MKRTVAVLGGLLAVIVGIVVIVGWQLPVQHHVSRRVRLAATPTQVYDLIAGVSDYPSWRTGVTRVELASAPGQPERYWEDGADGRILFEVAERMRDRRIVVRIADPSLPFGGRWVYEITPSGSGSELRITEDGEVYNPVFRFVSRYVIGHARTVERYLTDVERYFGRG